MAVPVSRPKFRRTPFRCWRGRELLHEIPPEISAAAVPSFQHGPETCRNVNISWRFKSVLGSNWGPYPFIDIVFVIKCSECAQYLANLYNFYSTPYYPQANPFTRPNLVYRSQEQVKKVNQEWFGHMGLFTGTGHSHSCTAADRSTCRYSSWSASADAPGSCENSELVIFTCCMQLVSVSLCAEQHASPMFIMDQTPVSNAMFF